MHLVRFIRDALSMLAAMLGLVVVGALALALGIWGALIAVLP